MSKIKTFAKETVEKRRYEFDFAAREEIVGGATITDVLAVTFTPADDALEVIDTAISPDGKIVQALIDAGTNGTLYVVKCEVKLSDETILVTNGMLQIRDVVAAT